MVQLENSAERHSFAFSVSLPIVTPPHPQNGNGLTVPRGSIATICSPSQRVL